MELFPALQPGWFNGWIGLAVLAITEGTLFLVFPKPVVARLFDRSGWNPKQWVFTVAGKLCALACLALIILTPLKIGHPVLMIGVFLLVAGWIGLVKALLTIKIPRRVSR